MPGIDQFVVFGSHLDGADGATSASDFSIAQAAKTITFVGNAQIDTAQSKFGGAALLLDGTGDRISVGDSDDFFFNAGDFTIDMQVRFAVVNATHFYMQRVDANNRILFRRTGGATLQFAVISGGTTLANYTVSWTPSQDTWYHIAIARQGTSIFMFIEGVSQTLNVLTAIGANSIPNLAATPTFGEGSDLSDMNGWIDEIRVSKGIARWTASFTPPTAPYSVGGPSKIMLMGVS